MFRKDGLSGCLADAVGVVVDDDGAVVVDERVAGLDVVVVVVVVLVVPFDPVVVSDFSPFFDCVVVLSPAVVVLVLRVADGEPIDMISARDGLLTRGEVTVVLTVGDVIPAATCDRVVVRVVVVAGVVTLGDVTGGGDARRGDVMVVVVVGVVRGERSVVAVDLVWIPRNAWGVVGTSRRLEVGVVGGRGAGVVVVVVVVVVGFVVPFFWDPVVVLVVIDPV